MVLSTADRADGRKRRALRITPRGRAALKKWLVTGVDPDLISSVTDPIRSRTFFLGVLSDAGRVSYLNDLVIEMERFLGKTRNYLNTISRTDDIDAYFGALGAVRITEARLEWLQEVRNELSHC